MKEIWTNAFQHASGSFNAMAILYALAASILVLVIMRKTGLLRRNAKWHQTLVCLYYLYIPLLFIGGAVAWSAVGAMESTVLSTIDQARPAISSATADYAGSAWKAVTEKFRKDPSISLREICLSVTREYAAELLEGLSGVSRFTAFMTPLVDTIREGVALSLAKLVEEDILKKVSGAARLDRETLKTLWTADIVAAMQGGIVCDILAGQTRWAFKSAYQQVRMAFLLLLLPVVLETAFAVYRRRRKTGTA